MTLYIGGLEAETNEDLLRSIFSPFGEVSDTRVVVDDKGACRGFAYVTFTDDLAAAKARVALNGKEVDGRTLRVAVAT